jgi:hypothetical protein
VVALLIVRQMVDYIYRKSFACRLGKTRSDPRDSGGEVQRKGHPRPPETLSRYDDGVHNGASKGSQPGKPARGTIVASAGTASLAQWPAVLQRYDWSPPMITSAPSQ